MKSLAKKKNNKGFSLVELIVVILIMAIIAVALAPQVMKWVGRSSENTDENNAATIKSSVQTAIADYLGDGKTFTVKSGSTTTYTFYVLKDGLSTDANTQKDATGAEELALQEKIEETMGEYPAVKANSKHVFKIEIKATDSVTSSVVVGTCDGTYEKEPTT